jgi:ketosteroid isomerase-like protein
VGSKISAEDCTEITNLLGRYHWLLDGGEAEAWAALFTADGTVLGVGQEIRGRDALIASAAATFAGFQGRMRHSSGSLWIESAGSQDEAIARYYVFVTTWLEGAPPALFNLALCEARLRRTPEGWKIRSNAVISLRAAAAEEAMGGPPVQAKEASSEALAVAQRLIEGLRQRDPDVILPLLAENVVLEVPFPLVEGENRTGARRSSGQAVRDYLRDVRAATSDIRFDNVVWRTTTDGVAIFQADGKLTLSNGGAYENHYLMMFEVVGGKVVRWREYLSPIVWARSSGVPLDTLPS